MLSFSKMHGLGNDFVFLDHMDTPREITPRLAARLADRRLGVGCDQVVQLLPPADQANQVRMRIFNPDGSEAEMCGNAIRCVAWHLRHRNIPASQFPGIWKVETLAGVMLVWAEEDQWVVDMGPPRLEQDCVDRPMKIDGVELAVTAVSMGNPHGVVFTDDAAGFPLARIGPLMEHHPAFPNRVNLEVVQVLDRSNLRMRVWERGAGITPACGTGACAATVAAILKDHVDRDQKVRVRLDGGDLLISWHRSGDCVLMAGPATLVFTGEISLEEG